MKTFCRDLTEHTLKISKFKKLKMLPWTDEQSELYKKQKLFHVFKISSSNRKYCKVRDHCHYTGQYRDTAQISVT